MLPDTDGKDIILGALPVPRLAPGVALLCGLIVVRERGFSGLLGAVCAGFVILCWAFIYAHVMCAHEQLDWRRMMATGVWGAATALAVVSVFPFLGEPLAALVVICALVWLACVTPSGHLTGAPHRAATWLAKFRQR